MNPVIGRCPICRSNLEVTRMHCRNCDTALEGHFTLGRLYHLNKEQLEFVETFIRCEGKITRVEQEMGMSYPAVRSRLNDVIRALGYEVGDTGKESLSEEERRSVLSDVAEGKISAEEAVDLLRG
ncbi:MAG TPA: DUF2089 domain-containing protein [Candidatus Sulfomarinibacteraceae bacterium]|nr:DUF2089 domain-containing protein [Candidatus Sulfomarinibacteraceae bacterium]